MIKKNISNLLLSLKGISFENQYKQITSVMNDDHVLNKSIANLKKKLLLHSHKNVSFYTTQLEKNNVVKDDTVIFGDFNRLPLLTKDDIRVQLEQLTSRDIKKRKWRYKKTSGSTGTPLKYIQDKLSKKWGDATYAYYCRNMLKIDEIAAKKIILLALESDLFGGIEKYAIRVFHWLQNRRFHLNSLRITESDMERCVKAINSYKPLIIRSPPIFSYELCKYIERKGKTIHRPKVFISSYQKLFKYMREKIEGVFGVKVHDFYGARETPGIAGECNEGLMHIFTFNNFVEILDEDNRQLSEGKMGKIVVTNLHNYSMPLIRYELGDKATLGPDKCKCGNPLPTLKEVNGRTRDFFIKDDGSLINGVYFMFLLRTISWIKAFRVIQEDYRKIRILIVPFGNVINIEKREIEQKIKKLMGIDCKIIWEFVDEVPSSRSGKYIYIESLLQRS
jgi:phenylacetate-CoA ligase